MLRSLCGLHALAIAPAPARLALVALNETGLGSADASALDLMRSASPALKRPAHSQVRMVRDIRTDLQVNVLKQNHVLNVVTLHRSAGLGAALHGLNPELHAVVL